ncbi:MAG TPA: hypothetical protein VLZ10_01325 [Thermodesulfobacteriota bacterium]|nr:hypothetical protein [Thermodesulfobacteriota bacterium]
MAILRLIFYVIVFCIFIGMFLRLGRIEFILKKMALHQGAIEKGAAIKTFFFINAKE